MYAACLFCNRGLGRNEALDAFPVGRRLAYDAARGRLWVVCAACGRWNLTPLEERWEAIEQAERLFRATRLRTSTDNVGLARVADGTDLVRVGAPLRPEFAAWRYGAVLRSRRWRTAASAGGMLGAIGAGAATAVLVVGWPLVTIGSWGTWMQIAVRGRSDRVIARLEHCGHTLEIQRGHLAETGLSADRRGAVTLDLRHANGRVRLDGDAAARALAALVPALNRYGAGASDLSAAVRAIEARGEPRRYLAGLAYTVRVATRPAYGAPDRWTAGAEIPATGLFALGPVQRLALEMAVHEEQERRAVEGELAELERAWRDAEEIAVIADDLALPDRVRQAVDRLRARGGAA